ncbi:unnamed protein product [Trifolium pratense]|uniref:Uncharacterized protein n=1 Tax=Trifolium pratense TaxID=57577 RepID=A0ACB0IQ56_TRIPR|nr:unnamed protein product [Trifolium pratense]
MESEFVKRRIDTIAAHFAPNDEISPTHLLPMNCSGSLNSVFRRCDNKVYFARQTSSSFGYFMRQASLEEGGSDSFVAPKTNVAKCEGSNYARAPCFAKPAKKESILSNSVLQPMTRMQGYDYDSLEPPTFSRPSKKIRQGEQLNNEKRIHHSEIETEWSPRMDVAEAEGKYVIMVEVPGVNVGDIRVEVDDQKLSIKGRRSTSSWKVAGCPNASSFSSYHKREILYGPYEVVWPLPAGVNKENISAEFLDGFLQIIIPKV